MHFDLIDLKLFQHTLECGNITAGASRSHLSLPAASTRIRAMEHRWVSRCWRATAVACSRPRLARHCCSMHV